MEAVMMLDRYQQWSTHLHPLQAIQDFRGKKDSLKPYKGGDGRLFSQYINNLMGIT